MGDLSSAQTVGGAVVVYDVDLRPLEDGDRKAHQIVQKLSGLKPTARLELDTKGAEKQVYELASSIKGMAGISGKPITLAVDTSRARAEVYELKKAVDQINIAASRSAPYALAGELSPIDAASGRASGFLNRQLTLADDMERAGAKSAMDQRYADYLRRGNAKLAHNAGGGSGGSGSGGGGGPLGGGGGGGHPSLLRTNLLSMRGLERVLPMATLAAVGLEGIRLESANLESQEIARHPETYLRQIGAPGSGLALMGSSFMGNASVRLAQIDADVKFRDAAGSAFLGIPGMFMAGGTARLVREGETTKFRASQAQAVAEQSAGLRIASAQMAGDPIVTAREEADREKQAASERAESLYGNSVSEHDDWWGMGGITRRSNRLDSSIRINEQAYQDAVDNLHRVTSLGDAKVKLARKKVSADTLADQMETVGLALTTSGIGKDRLTQLNLQSQAMDLRHSAALSSFDATDTGQLDDVGKKKFAADRAKLVASQKAESDELKQQKVDAQKDADLAVFQAVQQGHASLERANKQFFAAEQSEFEAAAKARLESVRHATDAEKSATQTAINQERQAMQIAHAYDLDLPNNQSRQSVTSSRLRMQRRFFQAGLSDFAFNTNRQLDLIEDPGQRAQAAVAAFFQQQTMIGEHRRDIALQGFGLDAMIGSSKALVANNPLNARAIEAVANARLAVANADPELRGKTIDAQRAQLQAIEHDLVGMRGGAIVGGMTSDMALAATGFGLDLGSAGRDRRLVQATIGGGMGNLSKSIPGTDAADPSAAMIKAANDFVNFLKSKLRGISLYTSGS